MRTQVSLLSCAYMCQPNCSCLRLFTHPIDCALVLALASAGRSSPARIAIVAITTRSSTSVKPCERKQGATLLSKTPDERCDIGWASIWSIVFKCAWCFMILQVAPPENASGRADLTGRLRARPTARLAPGCARALWPNHPISGSSGLAPFLNSRCCLHTGGPQQRQCRCSGRNPGK